MVPWIGGVSANRARLAGGEVERFVGFVRSLHTPAPADAPRNLFRAKGWAIFFAAILLDTGLVDNPENMAIGENTFRQLTSDNFG